MRILATSDTHYPVDIEKTKEDGSLWFPKEGIDCFIHAGDLMYHGYESEWKSRLEWLEKLPYKKKFMVMGNHEMFIKNYPGPALQDLRSIGVFVIGAPTERNIYTFPDETSILGLPFVTGMKNWAFNSTEKELEYFLSDVPPCDIVISHCPPYGILDKEIDTHNGMHAYRNYFERCSPSVWISGHFHLAYGHIKINNTDFYNVAMCDRKYQQVNPPMVIDI